MDWPLSSERQTQLLARVAELEEEVALLRGDPSAAQQLRPLGFSPRQARMLVMLAQQAPAILSREAIAGADNPVKGIDVLVCKTRRILKLIDCPGTVETIHGNGYRANAALAAWVLHKIQPEVTTDEG